jgi:hypothetical protein
MGNDTGRLLETEIETVGSLVLSFRVDELRPHPSYTRHKLSVHAAQFSTLDELGDLAFKLPLVITRERIIVDGYARWALAKRQGRLTLPCIEYDLNEQDALKWLIRTHLPSHGHNDFARIELALDLELHFKNKALFNRQEGGRLKGLSNLTEAEKVNCRAEIARVAHVSVGNVHKVKYILTHACSPLKEAVTTGEISIHLAHKWSHEAESEQQEYLRLSRIEKGLKRKARQLVAAEIAKLTLPTPTDIIRLSDFTKLVHELAAIAPEQFTEISSIEVKLVQGAGCAIFATEELIHAVRVHQEVLVR